MLALIDGDIVVYRACVVQKREIDWDGDGSSTQSFSVSEAVKTAVDLTKNWTRNAGGNKTLVCLSPKDGNTFRKHIVPGYKNSRPDEKPTGYWEVVEALENEFAVLRCDGIEADDALGITSTNPRTGPSVIVTADKDMQSIPGLYFRPGRDEKPRRISEMTANYFWMVQTLIGDPTDGYKGCPGIGIKKAQAALADVPHTIPAMWERVQELFIAKGLDTNDAVVQARAARILRHGDYDEGNKLIWLWTPHRKNPDSLAVPLPTLSVASSLPSTPAPPKAESPEPQTASRKRATRGSSSRGR